MVSEIKTLLFQIANGFSGSTIQLHDEAVRLHESLRRWNADSEVAMFKAMKSSLQHGDCFIDIGANFGLHTLYGARLVGAPGKVYSVEPMKENIQLLNKHLKLNKATNVEVVESAISAAKTATLTFYFPKAGLLQTGAIRSTDQNTEQVIVQNMTLDQLSDLISKPAKLIKIDVEGAEFDVLRSGSKLLGQTHPDLLIEIHPKALIGFDSSPNEIIEYLNSIGYKELRLPSDG